jgi:hypothetical protein
MTSVPTPARQALCRPRMKCYAKRFTDQLDRQISLAAISSTFKPKDGELRGDGQWEGDLILGARRARDRHAGERMTRFIVLMHMPARKAYVATSAVAGALNAIPPGPCARPGPMTRARRGLVMRAWRGRSARASSLPIHTHPGSAVPTRTPTVFCGSMSRRDALVGVRPK